VNKRQRQIQLFKQGQNRAAEIREARAAGKKKRRRAEGRMQSSPADKLASDALIAEYLAREPSPRVYQ